MVGHRDVLCALAFSPDGASLATGSLDGSVLIWDVLHGPAGPATAARGGGGVALRTTLKVEGAVLAVGAPRPLPRPRRAARQRGVNFRPASISAPSQQLQ